MLRVSNDVKAETKHRKNKIKHLKEMRKKTKLHTQQSQTMSLLLAKTNFILFIQFVVVALTLTTANILLTYTWMYTDAHS